MKIDFCFPVYNEEQILEKNILTFLDYLRQRNWQCPWRVSIVVNGSQDKSLSIAQDLARQYPEEIDFYNLEASGKGLALKKHLSHSRAEVVFYMDIDLAVSLKNVEDILEPTLKEECDLVLGSRLLPESRTDRSFIRGLSSQMYNKFSRLFLGHSFKDLQCGFKAVRVSQFHSISGFLESDKWFFDTELIAWGLNSGFKIKEVPVDWSENRYEKRKSKVNVVKDGIVFFWNLLKLKQRIKRHNRRSRLT
ncbi:MAG TPA: glycosyltransferase [Patescibacteria group bacterium]|nr:glycosyltransferase [Patescibacteria group bacterium]